LVLAANQSISGDGIVLGDVTAPAGARILPGSNGVPGTLVFGNNLSVGGGATLQFDLADSTTPGGGTNDLLIVNGNLDLSGTVSVNFNFLNQSPVSPATYTLIQY